MADAPTGRGRDHGGHSESSPTFLSTAAVPSSLQWQRRVIVFADLVESVRLMQRHEADAIERWRHFSATARDTLVPAHGGRVLRTAGDGLLIGFDGVAGALDASFAMHAAIAALNEGRGRDDAMLLRIGVHIGQVAVDVGEIYGTEVNLCARLASIAPAGQTVLSAQAREEVVDSLHADLEDMGSRYVKHLDAPLRAWSAHPRGTRATSPRAGLDPAPDLRPAIAVVPFVAMPADPAHDALGMALADDIIAALAHHPALRVLSRATTASLRGDLPDWASLRRLLDASYLLTGRCYLHGSKARAVVELASLTSGEVLWSGGAAVDVQALFNGEDELVPHIVEQVSSQVAAYELKRVRKLPLDSLPGYTLYVGAGGLMNSLEPQNFARAREVLDHLAERYPRQAGPPAMLARWHVFRVVQGWTDDGEAECRMAQAQARRAIDVDPGQPMALVADGEAQKFIDRDFERARRRYEAALAADPHYPDAWKQLSEAQSECGEHEAALASARRAMALSPLDPMMFLFESFAARAAVVAQRFDEAIELSHSSLRRHLMHAPVHRLLVGALWLAGREEESRVAAQRAVRLLGAETIVPTLSLSPRPGPFSKALHQAFAGIAS